jgi:hypothetical protein
LNGTVELVLIEVRQPIVGKSPYPGLRCTRALRKTKTSSAVILSAITRSIKVQGVFWPQALSGSLEIDHRKVTIDFSGKVPGALTRLGVDVVYLHQAIS